MINNVSFKGWGFGLGGFSECKETEEKKTDPYERLLHSPSDIFCPYNETQADEFCLEDISEKEEMFPDEQEINDQELIRLLNEIAQRSALTQMLEGRKVEKKHLDSSSEIKKRSYNVNETKEETTSTRVARQYPQFRKQSSGIENIFNPEHNLEGILIKESSSDDDDKDSNKKVVNDEIELYILDEIESYKERARTYRKMAESRLPGPRMEGFSFDKDFYTKEAEKYEALAEETRRMIGK